MFSMLKKTELISIINKLNFRESPLFEQDLSKHTSFKSGGKAWVLVKVSSVVELQQFIALAHQHSFFYLLIGRGSNVLFTDLGFHGVIVLLGHDFKEITINENKIEAFAGVHNRKVAQLAAHHGLKGAEFLATIPGSVGGSLYMNAGAHLMEMHDITESIQVLDNTGKLIVLDNNQLEFGYRKSIFMRENLSIVSCIFKLEKGDKQLIKEKIATLTQKRKDSQPIHRLTWGSVFKNPPNQKAGYLIEQCGLRGRGYGDVKVSQMHANFIENHGDAQFCDIRKTILLIMDKVKKKFQVDLELEVRIYDHCGNLLKLKPTN